MNTFDYALNNECKNIIGCPVDILDDIITEEVVLVHTINSLANKVLSKTLKDIGIKLKFTQLDYSQRRTIFTYDACRRVTSIIIERIEEGMLIDFIAMDLLVNDKAFNNLDCQVYFKGVELFNQ